MAVGGVRSGTRPTTVPTVDGDRLDTGTHGSAEDPVDR
jgi:hypothetical protein